MKNLEHPRAGDETQFETLDELLARVESTVDASQRAAERTLITAMMLRDTDPDLAEAIVDLGRRMVAESVASIYRALAAVVVANNTEH